MPPTQSPSQGKPPQPAPLFASYAPRPGVYDEYRDGRAQPGSPWRRFAERLDRIGSDGLASQWRRGEDLLRENGIAHNLLAGESETTRRWNLDPIPLLLTDTEWEHLSQGAIQRARLWDTTLRDLYGPQTLLGSGTLPASLLFSLPNYNRPLRFLPSPGRPLLAIYAVDVARGPDGTWTVVADRTEAPNGTGFALENRIVLTNVFPETTKDLHLVRLASFFQHLRCNLHAYAPPAVENPKVVLLSPGPGDPSYFEDAYLTRYLGITLAVGEELTIRNDRLYLKTVGGLQRVHVLVRRIPENETDPLETPTSSQLGVPGLMQAVRAGSVVVINPPGTGIAEAPALLPFLPDISRHIFGEDLLLPSIESRWTGNDPDAAALLDAGPAVVKSAFGRHAFHPVITRHLRDSEFARLRRDIAERPGQHVVQREMPFSTAPAWTGRGLEPRPVALRLFLFAEGSSWRVLPGGLVRCATDPDSLPGLTPRRDSSSKDLWILTRPDRPPEITTNLTTRAAIRRRGDTLSSRSADNMLWIGRYSERAEFATRVLLEIVLTATAEQDSPEFPPIPPLLRTLARLDFLDPPAAPGETNDRIDRPTLLRDLTTIFLDPESRRPAHLSSIPGTLQRLHHLAALSRDRLSNESWRIIRNLDSFAGSHAPATLAAFRGPLQQAILLHSALNGTARDNITRSESWDFLDIGRRLERCVWLLTLVEECLALHPALPSAVLDAALSITDCTLTYRYRYQGAPQPLPALDLLLFDPSNPRGLAYQLADLDQRFANLPGSGGDGILRPAHRTILKALGFLRTELLQADDDATEAAAIHHLHAFVAGLLADLPAVADQLGWEFFTHTSFTAS